MEPQTKPVLLFLADISGYTRFMLSHEKALAHSQMIIGELLETLIRQIDLPLKVAELEGDAIFMYSLKTADGETWRRRSPRLVKRMLGLFEIFGQRVVELGAYSVCRCPACSQIDQLRLKIVAHSGEALFTRVGGFPVVSGLDVITVHKLLKNSVDADQYVLMTESAYRDLALPEDAAVVERTEEYDIGTLKTYLYLPEVTVEYDEDAIRRSFSDANVGVKILRNEIRREYTDVASNPWRGFHFNAGRAAAEVTEYDMKWIDGIPDSVVESFAGTGNPFSLGDIDKGEHVVDVGSGAGLDSLIAAQMVGPDGHVIGVDMTPAMLEKARTAAAEMGLAQVEFREGYAESLPVLDGWADVVISNGVVNLSPDKQLVFAELFRVLRPGGRLQLADISVLRPVPEGAKRNIDLWTN
jgi:2-polyprenyl-3-methyl-5-hydroxy-6-metoxy-1,4-benzoquinol methylase